jgi:hypothetical protein
MSMWGTEGWRECDRECNEIERVQFLRCDGDTGVEIKKEIKKTAFSRSLRRTISP